MVLPSTLVGWLGRRPAPLWSDDQFEDARDVAGDGKDGSPVNVIWPTRSRLRYHDH